MLWNFSSLFVAYDFHISTGVDQQMAQGHSWSGQACYI